MVAYDIIERLERVVAKFLNGETYGNISSDEKYQRELERIFDNSTIGISNDLEADYDDLLVEDCDITIDAFKQDMNEVQERVEVLKKQFESVTKQSFSIEDNKARAQYLFCKRMVDYINELIERVTEWRDGALTSAEEKDPYFNSVKYDRCELQLIYKKLIANRWVTKQSTPLRAFLYYFTGEGLKPTKPIRWLPDITYLTLFLERITYDGHKWAKAAKVFDKDTGTISRKTLSVSYDRVYKEDIKMDIDRILDRSIFNL